MIPLLQRHLQEITAICQKHGVRRLDLFGSAAVAERDDAAGDADFFYEFDPDDKANLVDRLFGLQDDLERVLGVTVDLVSSRHVRNQYFLNEANRHRVTLYAA